jgi:hypothetical protein
MSRRKHHPGAEPATATHLQLVDECHHDGNDPACPQRPADAEGQPGAGEQPGAEGPAGIPGTEVTPAELTAARVRLLLHRLDPASEGCAACGRPSPCATSQDAAHLLAATGAWNTLEVPSHFAPLCDLLTGLPAPFDSSAEPSSKSRGTAGGRVRLLLRRLGILEKPRRRNNER